MGIFDFLTKKKSSFADLNVGYDIHSHILNGVDDGFTRATDSYEALRRYQERGYKKLFLTPHMNLDSYSENNETMLRERFCEFVDRIPGDITLDLRLGAEYMVNETLDLNKEFLTYADKKVLIEMSYYYESPNIRETIFELGLQGYSPVLAHPERYLYYTGKIKEIEIFVDMGCQLQLNILSLTPYYSPETVVLANKLLEMNLYSYAGTDLHSLHQLSRIFEMTAEQSLMDKLNILMENNSELFD